MGVVELWGWRLEIGAHVKTHYAFATKILLVFQDMQTFDLNRPSKQTTDQTLDPLLVLTTYPPPAQKQICCLSRPHIFLDKQHL